MRGSININIPKKEALIQKFLIIITQHPLLLSGPNVFLRTW